MDGEGNFNWRFVFPFCYIPAEKKLVIKEKVLTQFFIFLLIITLDRFLTTTEKSGFWVYLYRILLQNGLIKFEIIFRICPKQQKNPFLESKSYLDFKQRNAL